MYYVREQGFFMFCALFRHTYNSLEGAPLFRIIQRTDDNKLEIQFEKQALEVHSRTSVAASCKLL